MEIFTWECDPPAQGLPDSSELSSELDISPQFQRGLFDPGILLI